MKYVNVKGLIPDELVKELQKYVTGNFIYIPKPEEKHNQWGEKTGSREYYSKRNSEITRKYINGADMRTLAEEYFLSIDSIKKIIVKSKNAL